MSWGGASSDVGEVCNPRDHRVAHDAFCKAECGVTRPIHSLFQYTRACIVNSCYTLRFCIRELQVPGAMQVKDTFHSKILYGIIQANLFFSGRPKADLEVPVM